MELSENTARLCSADYWSDLSPAVDGNIDECSLEKLNISLFCALTGNMSEKDRRYQAGDDKTPVDVPDISESGLLTITEAKQLAAVKFAYAVRSKKISGTAISAETGMHVSAVSRLLDSVSSSQDLKEKELPGGKPRVIVPEELNAFPGVTLSMIPVIAAFVLERSCNEMFFNTASEVHLPFSPYNAIVAALEQQKNKNADLSSYIQYGRALKDVAADRMKNSERDYNTPAECLWSYGQYRPAYEVLRERFDMLRSEVPSPEYGRGVFFPETKCSAKVLLAIKSTMSGICPGVAAADIKNIYTPTIDTPMFWTLSTWVCRTVGKKSLDFFLANDFIRIEGGASDKGTAGGVSKICLPAERGGSDTRQITDSAVLRALSFCFALPADLKAEYISKVLSNYF